MDKLSTSTKKSEGAFGKFAGSIKSWATGIFGITAIIAAVTAAIRAQIQAMKEHAQIAAEQQKKLLELQFLGDLWKERPELRKEIAAQAEYGRRPFIEVVGARYNLLSKAARLSDEQRAAIMHESLELGRMYPSAPLATLVDMFSLYTKQTGAVDINRVQNILLQTITEAGGGMADVAKYMPQFLPIGLAGGLTGPQTAGLWAHVTTQLAEPSIATTGLKAAFFGLQAGTPEAQEMMQQLGITPDMDFFKKIQIISAEQRAGRFGLPEARRLAGLEGSAVLLSMLKDVPAMMQTIGNVVGAAEGERDITKTAIEGLMSTDEIARLEDRGRQLDVRLRNIKGSDTRAHKWDVYLKEYEMYMREADYSEAYIKTALGIERLAGVIAPGGVEKRFQSIRKEFRGEEQLLQQAPTIINYNDYSIRHNPIVGYDEGQSPQPRTGVDIP